MKAISFEEVQKILELKATEIELDELVFNSTLTEVENGLGYKLEDRNFNEIQTIKNMEAYLDQKNITEMINIIDMNTKERIPNCVIDGQRIIFLHHQYEGHVAFFNYNAGYTSETLPADLKEAIIKMFLIKKKEIVLEANNPENNNNIEMPHTITKVLNIHRRKTL